MKVELKLAAGGNGFDTRFQAEQAVSGALLHKLFAALEERHIAYCVLRDGDHFQRLADQNELDLLVAAHHLDEFHALASELDLVHLPSWGHAPHHFFLSYDEAADRWLKLDVVTEISYGRPIRALRTTLAEGCIERRRRRGPTYIPSPEDEFFTLLLHCLLDKGRFKRHHRQRLQTLLQALSDHELLLSHLARYWLPSMKWSDLAVLIEEGDWDAILACEDAIVAKIAGSDRLGTAFRGLRDRALRKLNRWAGFWQPRVPMVALLAPDGAGKTTLSNDLAASSYFPVRSIYMGLYQKNESGSKLSRIPGLGLAGRILTQWQRYLSARYHQGRGRLVIFDRYTYDALLSSRRSLGILRKLRRRLLAYACPPPDLVIILDAPGSLLHKRKGEHSPSLLEEQRQEYLQLRSRIPQSVVVDARQDSDAVRRDAMKLIWCELRRLAPTNGGT